MRQFFETFLSYKVASIFRMMGTAFTTETLKETISEIDVDGD